MSDEHTGASELDPAVREKLQSLIEASDVVLFMKGTKHFPRCGFSASVVEALKIVGLEHAASYVDVLRDPEIRSGLKVYSSWPTFPQLYVRGEFVGGRDIVVEMVESGELQTLAAELLNTPPS